MKSMKSRKLVLSALVVLLTCMGLSSTAFAAERTTTTTVVNGGPVKLVVTKTTTTQSSKTNSHTHRSSHPRMVKTTERGWDRDERSRWDRDKKKRSKAKSKCGTKGRRSGAKHYHAPPPSEPVLVKRTIYQSGKPAVVTYTKTSDGKKRRR